MIREATDQDVPQVVDAILAAYDDTTYQQRFGCPSDPESVRRLVLACLESENAGLFVVELDGRIAGVCLAEVRPFTWNHAALLACEHLWHMRPDWPHARQKREWFMRMYDRMRSWAASRGAASLTVNATPGTPAAKFLARKGAVHFENAYTERL